MTPLEFKAARIALRLNQREMAERLRVAGEATVRSWESGRRPISGPAAVAVELMLKHGSGWEESQMSRDEKSRVVAWLRKHGKSPGWKAAYTEAADAIERGEHLWERRTKAAYENPS